ncbi:hypothetical protein CEG14_05490 [Bordetella genomosp. 1]|uniref:Uncharacterized protein n=1 Tax=Bordetella genomosp. 1 TaxID=1395607 RepID=A0A261SQ84_9BORD|nr:hypothetical protein [Bordetella genomosp. 1]MDQ8035768.1 hypothetical protein [Bordetella sp.]OZI38990.1 hypothetical protein CEG14_05490 [Bordetella genomosp. 1]OZI65271.1 hypothetical protein CAL27_09480 [Bordetella genomosp. 1]
MEILAQNTSAELLARLEAAAAVPLSQDEFQQQLISFVYSVVGQRENMTRDKVEDLLSRRPA